MSIDLPEETRAGLLAEVAPGDLMVPDQLVDRTSGRERTFVERGAVHLPFALMRPQAAVLEKLPKPPVTRDQLKMLAAGDNVVTNSDAVDTFGLPLVPLDEQLRRGTAKNA